MQTMITDNLELTLRMDCNSTSEETIDVLPLRSNTFGRIVPTYRRPHIPIHHRLDGASSVTILACYLDGVMMRTPSIGR